ncbi:purine-binding chemotaxis protein CheW [Gammaproteobacteria bacterium]
MTKMPTTALSPVGETALALSLTEEQKQYLTFTLGEEVFATGILAVKEILRYGTITEVPMTHPCLIGMINLRGRVVPIIDLALRLGRKAVDIGKRTCIVIVEVKSGESSIEMGIVVDAVRAVLDIPVAKIDPPPAFGIHLHHDYMLGVSRLDDLFVVILDLARILAMDELVALMAAR